VDVINFDDCASLLQYATNKLPHQRLIPHLSARVTSEW
jgi:hypothetical protein